MASAEVPFDVIVNRISQNALNHYKLGWSDSYTECVVIRPALAEMAYTVLKPRFKNLSEFTMSDDVVNGEQRFYFKFRWKNT